MLINSIHYAIFTNLCKKQCTCKSVIDPDQNSIISRGAHGRNKYTLRDE